MPLRWHFTKKDGKYHLVDIIDYVDSFAGKDVYYAKQILHAGKLLPAFAFAQTSDPYSYYFNLDNYKANRWEQYAISFEPRQDVMLHVELSGGDTFPQEDIWPSSTSIVPYKDIYTKISAKEEEQTKPIQNGNKKEMGTKQKEIRRGTSKFVELFRKAYNAKKKYFLYNGKMFNTKQKGDNDNVWNSFTDNTEINLDSNGNAYDKQFQEYTSKQSNKHDPYDRGAQVTGKPSLPENYKEEYVYESGMPWISA